MGQGTEDNYTDESSEAMDQINIIFGLISEHSEVILGRSEEIDTVLTENLRDPRDPRKYETIINQLGATFGVEVAEEPETIARALLHAILTLPEVPINDVDSMDKNSELYNFLLLMSIKHQEDIRASTLTYQQDSNVWIGFSTDIVLRNTSGNVGFNHTIRKLPNEQFVISSSPSSTLYLSGHLLDKVTESIQRYGDQALEDIHPENINNIQNKLQQLRGVVEENTQTELGEFDHD